MFRPIPRRIKNSVFGRCVSAAGMETLGSEIHPSRIKQYGSEEIDTSCLPDTLQRKTAHMPNYTEGQQSRLIALQGVLLLLVLTMSAHEPETRLRDMIEDMHFVQEVKQAYPDNTLIQGVFEDIRSDCVCSSFIPFRERSSLACFALYIEEASAPLGVDIESREFGALLVSLVQKLTKDVEQGLFGDDPVMAKVRRDTCTFYNKNSALCHPIDRRHVAVSEAAFRAAVREKEAIVRSRPLFAAGDVASRLHGCSLLVALFPVGATALQIQAINQQRPHLCLWLALLMVWPMLIPVVVFLVLGERHEAAMKLMRTWFTRSRRKINVVMLGVFGILLLAIGLIGIFQMSLS